MTMPHRPDRPMDRLHPDLPGEHAKRHLAWLLEEPEADQRLRVGRRHRQRRRLTRTRTSQPA
jgi:hypothetical protein